jgi:hypothetical protein
MDSIKLEFSFTRFIALKWSVLAIGDYLVNLVSKLDNMLQGFDLYDSIKQGIELGFYSASPNMTLLSRFPKTSGLQKNMQALDRLFLVSSKNR